MTTKTLLRGIVRMFSKEKPGTILKRWRTRKDKVTTTWSKGEAERRGKAAERRKQDRRDNEVPCRLCGVKYGTYHEAIENGAHRHKRRLQNRRHHRRKAQP